MKTIKRFLMLAISMAFISNSTAQQINHVKNMNKTVLKYSDGNGNYYKITKDSISYQPISREMSSSGMYDGGKPAKKGITDEAFKKLFLQFEAIFKNKNIQISNRIKTSGKLSMNTKEADTKTVIIKKSDEQKQLELLLKELLE